MKKELRKSIEAELAILINNALSHRNKQAAQNTGKQIRESVKSIAKKFVKSLPEVNKAAKPVSKTVKIPKVKNKLKKVKSGAKKSVKAKSKAAVKKK